MVLYGKGVLLWNTCYVFMFVLTSEYTCILNIEFCVISLPNYAALVNRGLLKNSAGQTESFCGQLLSCLDQVLVNVG